MTPLEVAAVRAVISTTLNIVVNKLAPPVIQWYSSVVHVEKYLHELLDLIKEIVEWLEKTGYEAMVNDKSFNWLKKLREVASDVDDIVDEFQLEAEKNNAGANGGILSKYKSFKLQCKAANKIKKINKRFAAIVKQRSDFSEIANSLQVRHPVRHVIETTFEIQSLPVVDAASVLGRDQDKDKIITELVKANGQQKIEIISVIGLGGSGKTTLAKLIFSDAENIKKHFELTLWVHVSQEFNVEILIKKLFEAVTNERSAIRTLPYISEEILKGINGKRFLLVLDDVWTGQKIQWEHFMVHLKGGKPESKILLTSRSRGVAEDMESIYIFDVPILSLDDSWQLFHCSFGAGLKGLSSEFQEVGKEIVKKCGGMPLAIKSFAGVLRGKEHIEEWKAMRDNNLLDVEGEEHRVAACLWLTYFHLPSNLKQCFTICSMFPKGHNIDKEQLIDLWIAHDMITQEDCVDCLDLGYVGHKHFTSLLQVSFLQNVEENYHGRVTCGMHDLVHDLALSILGDEMSHDVPNKATSATKSYRYFSLMKWPENLTPKDTFRKARAVYMQKYGDYAYGMALKHAKHLRSVSVGRIYGKEANTISQVKYLKYLAISQSCEMLPEAISDVWRLQALHVTDSYSLLELPKSIGKLKMLRTLNLSGCGNLKHLPESIGDCQMISSIDLSWCTKFTLLPDSIGRNGKLRFLRLSYTSIERLPSTITTLGNLECLELQDCAKLVELPEGMGKLEKLQVLNLKDCEELGGMPIGIGQLSRLQKLGLFVVCKGEKFGGISELGNISTVGEELIIKGTSYVMDPDDAYKACLKQKTNLQRLELWSGLRWMENDAEEENAELEQSVLDGLEPPPGIKELEIDGYSCRQYAQWMLTEVGGRVLGPARFPFLKVMSLSNFLNLQHLNGLVELPCLEELMLEYMPSLQSISGGPFPSLVLLKMDDLASLEEVWMLGEKVIPEGEEGGDCNNCVPGLGQVQVGDCITDLDITDSPKLKAKLHLPSSLQRWSLSGRSIHLLQLPGQHEGACSSSSVNHLKKLELAWMTELECGGGWELLQHMTALESLEIRNFAKLTKLPESLGSLTSLRFLRVFSCDGIRMLPESIGELRSLQELTIQWCHSLSSLSQSMGHFTSLQELVIRWCDALEQLPDCLGELCSLRRLEIMDLEGLTCLPRSMCDLASLQVLHIRSCRGLASLPEGMRGLVSLENLYIGDCPGIKSLPEDIRGLTALKELSIRGCPDLGRRCERGTGEDWHLISHIPDLDI